MLRLRHGEVRAILVKIHGEFLDRVCVRRGKGQEVIHISRGEKESYEGRFVGEIEKEKRGRSSEEETDVIKTQKKTSQNVADGSMLHLIGITISPLIQGERGREYVCVAPDWCLNVYNDFYGTEDHEKVIGCVFMREREY